MRTAPSPPGSTIAHHRARWHGVSLLGVVALAVVVGLVTAVQPSVAAAVVSVIALATYGAIGAFALWSLKSNGFGRRPSFVILAFPTLSLVSAAWSLAPAVTLGFSSELLAAVLLATLTAAIVSADPDLGRSLV